MSVIKYKDSNGNYVKIPSSIGINNVVEGYYNETDSKFYEESTYETEITGESSKIYISLDTDKSYYWNGSVYKLLSGESVSDFDDLTNRPLESDAIDISELDLPMPAKPTDYPIGFDETGQEYKVGWYKRADGKVKPIWRKDVDFGKLPNSANKTVAHNINNIDKIVNIQINGVNDVSKEFVPLPYVSNSNLSAQVRWYVDSTNIYFFTGVDMSSYECFSCIFFTKTTDEYRDL